MNDHLTTKNDAKKVFKECGTCSRTFAHLLNREFGSTKETEERALDPLAGGIMQKGQQCGMIWGATLAVGAESYRKHSGSRQAIPAAIIATQNVMNSFTNRTDTLSCREITGCDLDSFFGMAKFMIKSTASGLENSKCFDLAEKWAPEAIESAKEGLSSEQILPLQSTNCASLVANKMGASDEEMTMVAGFAGGLGLSGNGCGALSAAIWMKTLTWVREHPGKSAYKNSEAKNILKNFYKATDSEILCHKICREQFKSIEDHSEFIKKGGCRDLIEALAHS